MSERGIDDVLTYMQCAHEHGAMVCLDCGLPLPAPGPRGYEIWNGEWDDESDVAYD